MKCVYCSLSGQDIKNAEFIIKGMSLCSAHYHGWEDGMFTIEDVEGGNIEIDNNKWCEHNKNIGGISKPCPICELKP